MTLQTIKHNAAEILAALFIAWVIILFMIDIGGSVFQLEEKPSKQLPPISEEFKTKTTPNSKCTQIGDVEVCEE